VTLVCDLQTLISVEVHPVIRPEGLVFHCNVSAVKKVSALQKKLHPKKTRL
jgi:hypothetical protein